MARPRKQQLWRADRVDVVGDIYAGALNDGDMLRVIECVSRLPDPAYFEDHIATVNAAEFRYAIADVVRRRWHPKLKPTMGGKLISKKNGAMIQAQGLVLSKLLDIVTEVCLFGQGENHPAYVWLLCALEANSHRAYFQSDEQIGKEATFKMYQRHSAVLRKRENPFEGKYNKPIFDKAVALAGDSTGLKADAGSDLFYPKRYLPYLEARAKLAALMRKKEQKVLVRKKNAN